MRGARTEISAQCSGFGQQEYGIGNGLPASLWVRASSGEGSKSAAIQSRMETAFALRTSIPMRGYLRSIEMGDLT